MAGEAASLEVSDHGCKGVLFHERFKRGWIVGLEMGWDIHRWLKANRTFRFVRRQIVWEAAIFLQQSVSFVF